MPPYKNIKPLQSLALDQVCKIVLDITPEMKRNVFAYREYFINNLHAWARTDILTCTKAMLDNDKIHHAIWQGIDDMFGLSPLPELNIYQIKKWLVIADTMLDVGVDRLPPLFFHQKELHKFVSILRDYSTHLKKLSVTSQMSNEIYCFSEMCKSMIILQKSLHEGLASRLVSLKLVAICDSSILKTIGEHALCLKHLDISGSWNVDEGGIKHLLFKNNVCLKINNVSNDKLCQNLSQLYDNNSLLNRCCFTLEELRIQDTSTKDTSLLMILACVKNLKSLGRFLQFKNVGDALIAVMENSLIPRIFQLTELNDMELTNKKIEIFNKCLPHLKILYTGLQCVCLPQDITAVEQGSMFWGRIHSLSIDLDYMLNVEFLNFMLNYGRNLSELILLDQEYNINVAIVLTGCPNLLSLKGYIDILDTPVGQFTKLRSIELHAPVLETVNWFFENCPRLEHAMLHCYSRNRHWNTEFFDSSSINMCNNLKQMEISFNDLYPMTDSQAVINFIDKCSSLQHLGRLEGWNLSDESIAKIKMYIKKKNYDLNIY